MRVPYAEPDYIHENPEEVLRRNKRKKILLFIELLLSFFAVPATIYLKLLPLPKFSVLIALSFFAAIIVLNKRSLFRNQLLKIKISRHLLLKLLLRFLLFVPLIISLTIILSPGTLFRFPLDEPLQWGLTALLYPLFSALPQEILYRVFFFYRYQYLFKKTSWLFFANAIAFSFLHIIYSNPVAIVLTFAGGLIFSQTYNETGSLPVTAIEHAIYGFSIFTTGLGLIYFN